MSKAAELAALIGSQSALSDRNMVVNGSTSVNQRGDSTGVTATGYYGPDRFQLLYTDAGTWSISQSSTAPEGFANSYKLDCTTAKGTLASDSRLFVQTKLEGQNLQQLKKGTSNAVSTTLSFFVRSNKTGTYQVNLEDNDNTRIIGSTYTISSANTFEHKKITFAGDTSGALTDDNGDSLSIMWALVAGTDNSSGAVPTGWEAKSNTDRGAGLTVNLADSTDNEWYISGIQFEVGEQVTSFEHEDAGTTLQKCQRYYYKLKSSSANNFFGYAMAANTTAMYLAVPFPVEMRSNPTSIDVTAGSSGNIGYWLGGAVTAFTSIGISESGPSMTTLVMQVSSGLSGEKMYGVLPNGSGSIGFSSEL